MDTMMDGLKKNMFMLIPQSIIMTWVTYFFSGFVVRTRPQPVLVLKGGHRVADTMRASPCVSPRPSAPTVLTDAAFQEHAAARH